MTILEMYVWNVYDVVILLAISAQEMLWRVLLGGYFFPCDIAQNSNFTLFSYFFKNDTLLWRGKRIYETKNDSTLLSCHLAPYAFEVFCHWKKRRWTSILVWYLLKPGRKIPFNPLLGKIFINLFILTTILYYTVFSLLEALTPIEAL
jgi:hypothetical protein